MDSKEIKAMLKEARESINRKDFTSSLRICKNILKADKQNYMGLIFFGISLQNAGPSDQAPNAFRKAIQISPNDTLAWQGLATYYEKIDTDDALKELIQVYEQLLNLESDASKFNDLCEKFVSRAISLKEINQSTEILKNLATSDTKPEIIKKYAWFALAKLLTKIPTLPTEYLPLMELTLATITKEKSSATFDYNKDYLKLLYKLKKYELLYEDARSFHETFDTSTYPLEWICKVYVELFVENDERYRMFDDNIEEYAEKLSKLESGSIMNLFMKAVKEFQHKKMLSSKDLIKQVISQRPGMLYAWILLCECWIKLDCINEAIHSITKIETLVQSLSAPNNNLTNKLEKLFMYAFSRSSDTSKLEKVIDTYEKIIN